MSILTVKKIAKRSKKSPKAIAKRKGSKKLFDKILKAAFNQS